MDQEIIDKAYYKPKESELIMGYECEVHTSKYEGNKFIVDEDQMQYACFCIRAGFLYTKYLTEEDVENEGWELSGNTTEDMIIWGILFSCRKKKDDNISYELNYFPGNTIHIRQIISNVDKKKVVMTIYIGKCPSINEFRYICKLLGI